MANKMYIRDDGYATVPTHDFFFIHSDGNTMQTKHAATQMLFPHIYTLVYEVVYIVTQHDFSSKKLSSIFFFCHVTQVMLEAL